MRFTTVVVLIALLAAGCGSPQGTSGSKDEPAVPAQASETAAPPAPGTVTRGDASTNLETTPISAADYAMYAAIMGGASAMLSTLSPADRHALEFARKVEAGAAKATPETEPLLEQARALRQKDIELARLQGIGDRYVKVKAKIEAVIGPDARPPAADDAIGRENLRYLEEHRASIERFQKILRDPLSKPAGD